VVTVEDEEEVLELDVEGLVEPELWAELVVVEEEVSEDESSSDTASVRFFDAVDVFLAAVAVVVLAVEDVVADLTTWVRPVAISAVSTARPAVAAAAVVRVRRLIRRVAADRARRCRVCNSFMESMEPPPSGTRLPASCESTVRGRGRPDAPLATLFRLGMPSRSAFLVAALAAVFAFAGSALPATKAGPLDQVRQGLKSAVSAGQLDQATANGYAALAARAVTEQPSLPPLRAQTLAQMLKDIAAQSRYFVTPQYALTLFAMLQFNEDELATHVLPPAGTDRYDSDGVLYRFVTGHGYEFHPLGDFGALNTLILAGKTDLAQQLAQALVARGVPTKDGRLLWDYPFAFGSGTPPWRSGMAQAVAAQALARTGQAANDQSLLTAADEAYAAIPGKLDRSLPQGPWIKLYSFDNSPVLNAQLQSAISIGDYAQISGNTGAAGLAAQLLATAETLLPKFDTGYWSLYSLGGHESPLSYQDFVVTLLVKLANRTNDTTWSDFATKLKNYETQAPVVNPNSASAASPDAQPIVIYPDPQDGYLDDATFTFWLSKLSTVTLHAGSKSTSELLGHGTQSVSWWPGLRAPGTYYPYLTVVDAAGNSTRVTLRQVQIKALAPPVVDAHVGGKRTLFWSATDEGTPWLHLVVKLQSGSTTRYRDLGHRPLAGRAVVAAPKGTWRATLVAGNSGHSSVTIQLGSVTGS
jgi:hypothetical protein